MRCPKRWAWQIDTRRKRTLRRAIPLLAIAGMMWCGPQAAGGAEISWGSPFVVQSPTDVRPGISVHFAADVNTTAGFGEDPVVINGVEFTRVGGTVDGVIVGIPGFLTHTFANGPNFGAAAFPGGTGSTALDNLLNSHGWHPGNPQTAQVTIEGLSVGAPYQIQVIGAVDTRTCCEARTYEPDDGQGNFLTRNQHPARACTVDRRHVYGRCDHANVSMAIAGR